MSRAAPASLNGHPTNAAAKPPVRVIAVGARGLTWSLVIQVVLTFAGIQRGIDAVRAEVRESNARTTERFDALDRRLSKLDGVPR